VLENLVVCLAGESGAPGPGSGSEMQAFVGAGRREACHPIVVDDSEAIDVRIGELGKPPVSNDSRGEGMAVLEEDVAKLGDGALPLHRKERVEVALGK
jgi:hypothetical protein